MSVSYFRSKLPIFIKFLSRRRARDPFSGFHGGFNLLPPNCLNPVRVFKHINPRYLIGHGIRFCHGNGKALLHRNVSSIVPLSDPGKALAHRNVSSIVPLSDPGKALAHRNVSSIVPLSDPGTKIPSRSWRARFVTAGFVVLVTVLFGRLEKVPYSERYHLVFSDETLDRLIAKLALKQLQRQYSHTNLLPPNHKQSVRVRTILEEILGGMNAGLRLQEGSIVVVDEWICDDKKERKVEKLSPKKKMEYLRERRKRKFGRRISTKHLEGLKWEVRVVDSYTSNACYIACGKIVVFSGLLMELKTDEELAIVLAHEVGHGVAQHISDHFMTIMWISFLALLSHVPNCEPLTRTIVSFINRRREMEADYIGLMLMASAGYDPRAAPKIFEETLGAYDSKHFDMYATHPKWKKRAEKLRKPKVMNRAVEIYREVTLGHGVRSFV